MDAVLTVLLWLILSLYSGNEKVATFEFISDERFRQSLDSDSVEIDRAFANKNWKSVHVLIGSVIEAVLTDYLLATDYQTSKKQDPLKMDMSDLIKACKEEGVLSEKTAQLSAVVKSYRNLIHPGRLLRLNEKVDENSAAVARALLEMTVAEVSSKRQEKYGYTAEQLVSKLERDPSAKSILVHLLKDMSNFEINKLLNVTLPKKYLSMAEESPPWGKEFDLLAHCFRVAFKSSPKETQLQITKKFVQIVKEESEYTISTYADAFFRAEDLEFLTPSELAVAKDYLFSRLDKQANIDVVRIVKGMGPYLLKEEVNKFTDPLIQALVPTSGSENELLAKEAKEILTWETFSMTDAEVQKRYVERLEEWIKHLESKEQTTSAAIVKEIKSVAEIAF